MKKMLCALLALVMVLSMAAVSAGAETTVQQMVISARDVTLNRRAGTLMVYTEDKVYQVMSAEGEVLSGTYADMSIRSGMYLVTAGDKEYSKGMLDGQGRQLVPCDYADVQVISDRFQAGVNVTPATAENYDYRFYYFDGRPDSYALIDTVDIWYCGTKVGTFERMDYDDATPYGDYLLVRTRDREKYYFDKNLNLSPVGADSYGEYEENKGVVTHNGSGQAAFTPGCALTKDEVNQYAWIQKGKVLDLQGNVIGDVSSYAYTYRPDGNLIKVRNGADLYGVVTLEGKEVIPCLYSEIEYDLDEAAARGYLYAVKDGKAGYVNLTTGAETGFLYSPDVMRQYGGFMKATDLDGSIILVSAAAGKLPEQYKDVSLHSGEYETGGLAIVQDMNGNAGVIGLYGDPVVPLDGTYTNLYNLEASCDGTVVVGSMGNHRYCIYRIDYGPEGGSSGADVPDAGWTCASCGSAGNTGKFCTECGAPKPEEPWTCSNGHGGNTGKFCTECGEPKPVETEAPAEPATWTCSCGQEGNTGNFCSNCGQPKP